MQDDQKTLEAVDSFGPTMVSGGSESKPVEPPSDLSFEGERYALRKILGAGGMGEVRLCDDAWIGRDVAMKVAHAGAGSTAAQRRGRFLREARIQGQLEHPSVVPVYDIGKRDGEPFFTMKRISGHTLEEVIDGLRSANAELTSKYNRRKLLAAMSQVCLTIAYAHSRRVIHRDLKPANVMLGNFGEVYVLDWGVAKLSAHEEEESIEPPVDAGRPSLTQQGAIVGTAGYMSPEQLQTGVVSPQSDVYALGAMLHEVLTLEPLVQGRNVQELLAATLQRKTSRRDGLPPELDAIVTQASAPDPNHRYASARAMHEAIEAFLDGERDAERRRELAAAHVKRGLEALARSERAEGMRELGRAIALDPSDESALRAISDLVLAPVDELPRSALDEIAAVERRDRARASGRAAKMYAVWLGLVPLMWVMGVRSWTALVLLTVLIITASAHAQWASISPDRATRSHIVTSMIINFTLVAACSCLFGPLVFVPGVAASSAAALILVVREKSWLRALPFLLGMLAVFVPLALEHAGVLPRAYTFDAGVITLHPIAVAFSEAPTTVAVLVITFVQLMLPSILLNRAVDALVDAERRNFAQAWRLRQLLPQR